MNGQQDDRKDARCADICRASREPLIGTATRVDVWLFVENPDAWRAKAIDDNDLAPGVNEWIAAAVAQYAERGLKLRPQFIRQARRDAGRIRMMLLEDGAMASRDLDSYDELISTDLARLSLAAPSAPEYFVCTNGQRDTCCSLYGMPLYRKLFALVGARAWQTSHVGGHRYAPNVLVAPSGELYGRVFEDEAEGFVEAIDGGRAATAFLRGRTGLDPMAQVAAAAFGDACSVVGVDGQTVSVRTGRGIEQVIVCESAESFEVIPSCGKPAETVRALMVDEAAGVSS